MSRIMNLTKNPQKIKAKAFGAGSMVLKWLAASGIIFLQCSMPTCEISTP
ncbi:unnamed protein product [marine sediment metagenome]|uniref:Uncharacterized protein n=1 Tax=marine sediment metagenome TaxID=412755 RepID=X1S376_9ZZZZ